VSGFGSGNVNLTFANPTYLSFGAGYIGGNWVDERYFKKSGNTGFIDYFNGQIADITFTR
jgi:hypothetical protein